MKETQETQETQSLITKIKQTYKGDSLPDSLTVNLKNVEFAVVNSDMFSKAYRISQADSSIYYFTGIIVGLRPDCLHGCIILGDCGNLTIQAPHPVIASSFYCWLGYSNYSYMLEKSSAQKEFSWDLACKELFDWIDNRWIGNPNLRHSIETDIATSLDCVDEDERCEDAFVRAASEIVCIYNWEVIEELQEVITSGELGMDYSDKAYLQWYQASYLGRYLYHLHVKPVDEFLAGTNRDK